MPQNTAGRGLVVGQHMIGILLAFLPHATNVQWRGLKASGRRKSPDLLRLMEKSGHLRARLAAGIP